LNLKNNPNIFVAGDIIEIEKEKLCQAASNQVDLIVENLKLSKKWIFDIQSDGLDVLPSIDVSNKLKKYRSKDFPLVITLGKYCGIFTWKNICFCSFFACLMKEVVELREMSEFWSLKFMLSLDFIFEWRKRTNDFDSISKKNDENRTSAKEKHFLSWNGNSILKQRELQSNNFAFNV